MKKLIFIVSILVSQISFAAGVEPLKEEITNKLILDLSMLELNEQHKDFVIVSFYICNDKIEISEIYGTQNQLVQKVKIKLSQLTIKHTCEEGKLYQYRFTFKKL